jgi:predicted transcriptional regulator
LAIASPVKKTISLPAEIAREVEALARAEGKTLSAIVQEALIQARMRRRQQELQSIQGYWSRKARDRGTLTEKDLDVTLREYLGNT